MTRSPLLSRAAPGILFALLVAAVWADPLLLRRNFAGRDILGYNLPIEKAVHDAWSRGRLPVWIEEISGGRPLAPNPNAGAFYPVRPLLALFPFPLAMRIYPALHWALAGLGTMLLLRTIGASRGAAWIGAVTYAFSGVSVSEIFYTNYQPGMTLLPWVVWAAARRGGSAAGSTVLLAVLLAADLVAGDVFTCGLALLGVLLWVALEVEPAEQRRQLGRAGLAFFLASLLAAPQIVSTALWIPHTNRGVLGMKVSEIVLYSISPLRLLELVVPFPFGPAWEIDHTRMWGWPVFRYKAMGFFSSLYAGAFAVVALVSGWRQRERGARFARVLFLFALAISIPPSLAPASWGELRFPLPLRFPEKFAVALVLSLAIFAALFFDRLRAGRSAPRWPLAVGGVLAVLALGAAALPAAAGRLATSLVGAHPKYRGAASAALPGALAEGGLLWMATVLAMGLLLHPKRRRLGAALLLLTLVPVAANRKIGRTFREEEVFSPSPLARMLSRLDPSGSYRVLGESPYRPASALERQYAGADPAYLDFTRRSWFEYAHVLSGRGTIFNADFDSGDLSRTESLRRLSKPLGFFGNGSFFGGLGLRWGVRYRDQQPVSGYYSFGGDGLRYWDDHERPFPDIRLVEAFREETGGIAALQALPRLEPGEVVIETGSARTGKVRPGRLRVLERSPERLLLEAQATDPTWLFAVRGYWPFRTVLLDGRPVEVSPAQIAFSALPVPPGRHTVEWKEELPGLGLSRWGPALFALSALLLWRSERRRKTGRA